MLNLSEPEGAGARRVGKAFRDLVAMKLIDRKGDPGRVPETRVLNPIGDQTDWNANRLEKGYITLPPALWQRGWIIVLSGRAIALLIILRELTNGRTAQGGYVDAIRKRQYGLSEDTWTRATKELEAAELLTVRRDVFSHQGEPRQRNFYTLHLDRLQDDPPPV
ncbi:hypothetical protein ACFXQA_05580 [Microbacterium sp. P07]|uniref:hypothetical protein n=1 Tax=Microbacterium sp. P07 TaxID=3366952 RepID=UPI003744F67E